ncbi:methyltransferase domain-containing protein, partial [Candidatus Woesearchaeota archaeon]|nr:methyltransferase domain-containing protein [Candidatus Woesearchaeota archaeon]
HFPEPQAAIKEMARVLKKNGLLCISDINYYLRPIHWLFEKLEPGCVHIYSPKEFENLFKEAGLTVLKQKRISLFALLTTAKK